MDGEHSKSEPLDAAPLRPKVFVSYSRKDSDFANQLVTDLTAEGFEAFLDTKAVGPGEPWQERLGALITKADSIAFVLSPDSVDPKSVCDWELNEAERLQKRIIPVVCRSVPNDQVPGRLRRLNYVFFTPERDRTRELARLVDGLKVDIRWIRQHTDIGEDAERWANPVVGGDHLLLQGKAISDAELWISSRPAAAPEPTETQRAFIQASREADIARISNEKRQIKRTKWFQRAVGVLLCVGLAGVIWQDIETTKREQAVFTSKADEAIKNGRHDFAMRLALRAYSAIGALPYYSNSSALEAKLAGAAQMTSLRARLSTHRREVDLVLFSPDGARLVTTSSDKTARVWDVKTNSELSVLRGHSDWVRWAEFSKDSGLIVTASSDDTARIWDATTGRTLHVLSGHTGSIVKAVFSQDSAFVATASSDRTARIWSARTGKTVLELKGHEYSLTSVAFSPDGALVATSSADDTARVWRVDTGEQKWVLKGHEKTVRGITFSPDGEAILTWSEDDTARIWDLETGETRAILKGHDSYVTDAEFSPDGDEVITASWDNTARYWRASGDLIHVLRGHSEILNSAKFNFDGTLAITASKDKSVRVWDLRTGTEISSLSGHDNGVNFATFSPVGNVAASASEDRTARIWDDPSQQQAAPAPIVTDSLVTDALLFPDDTRLLTASDSAQIWEITSGTRVGEPFPITDMPTKAGSVALTPKGDAIAVAEANNIRIWNIADRVSRIVASGHQSNVTSLAFSPDGQKIASAAISNTALVHNSTSGRLLFEIKAKAPINDIVFSPDGAFVATASYDRTARLWNAMTGAEIGVTVEHDNAVNSIAFSPNSSLLVTASDDNTAAVWNAKTGTLLAKLHGHKYALTNAIFSNDGRRILTASRDGTIRVFDASSFESIAVIPVRVLATELGAYLPVQSIVLDKRGLLVAVGAGWASRFVNLTWALGEFADSLRDRVCAEKLIGAQEFTDIELADPILSSIDKDDPVARNPCLRRGPLHWEYYTQAAARVARWTSRTWEALFPEASRAATTASVP